MEGVGSLGIRTAMNHDRSPAPAGMTRQNPAVSQNHMCYTDFFGSSRNCWETKRRQVSNPGEEILFIPVPKESERDSV